MVDIPNTTTKDGLLRSIGDGSNGSFWSLPFKTWTYAVGTATPVTGNSIPSTTTSAALSPDISVVVSGYTTYLVMASASFSNSDTGASHDGYMRLALDNTLTGVSVRTSLDKYSGGDYYYQMLNLSTVIITTPGQHTIALWGMVNGASTPGIYDDASITVLGIP